MIRLRLASRVRQLPRCIVNVAWEGPVRKAPQVNLGSHREGSHWHVRSSYHHLGPVQNAQQQAAIRRADLNKGQNLLIGLLR